MEGLLIAEQLRRIEPLLPSERLSWRFPDPYTFVLPLMRGAIWLYNKPPNARLAYEEEMPTPGPTRSGFQDLLVARAAGALVALRQDKLDRVVRLEFAAAKGFVETSPTVLIAELTGRNCNLILADPEGVILGVAREITADVNRFRQLRAGLRYQPPPPYRKLDPREATPDELEAALTGRSLKSLRKMVDGFGPDLTRALALTAGLASDKKLDQADIRRLLPVLEYVVAEPSRAIREASALPDIETLRKQEYREAQLQKLREAFKKQAQLLEKRLDDIDKARGAAQEAGALRRHADVLMAYAHQVPPKAHDITLTDFEGEQLTLPLDPQLDAVGNAQAMYERAKKREARAGQAEAREEALQAELKELRGRLEHLDGLPTKELDRLAEQHLAKAKTQSQARPGIRYAGPHGYSVLVGRNSQENEFITFRLARSKDLWLHAQGYPGSHVVIQADNREVPFETILYAAQLAAAYSKAGQSDNVPVDYTLRKNVWKAKGAGPGAVHFSQQKTVYVTPSRRPDKVRAEGQGTREE